MCYPFILVMQDILSLFSKSYKNASNTMDRNKSTKYF